jgi:hypothetical protein
MRLKNILTLSLAAVATGGMHCSSTTPAIAPSPDGGDAAVTEPGHDAAPREASTPSHDSGLKETGSRVDASRDTGSAPETGTGGNDSGQAGTWWAPGTQPLPWQWELDHEIVTSSTIDMGTGDTTYLGAAAAAPVVYDVDGFDNSAADVSALHALGNKVICYIEVGAAENYRPDYGQFAAADLGSTEQGYPDEKYININSAAVVVIMKARVGMCSTKGFDGIEPDIDDSYTDGTGFTITEAQNVAYLATLSDYAHSLGIAWGLKNGGDGGDPGTFVPDMLPHVDFAVVEEPFFLDTIGFFHPLLYSAGKALFVAEYTNDTSSSSTFCPKAIADHTNAALFDVNLDGMVRDPCQ